MEDHLCTVKTKLVQELNLAVHHVSFPCKKKYIYSEQNFYYHYGLFQKTVFGVPIMT
jgi:hypothetical protein